MRRVGTSFALILIFFYTLVISKKEIGKLYLTFEYLNPSESLIGGDKCDYLLTCDVYFSICVQSTGSTPCNIYSGKTEVYENVNELKSTEMEETVISLNSPIGNSVEIGIDIWDFDGIDGADLIAHFDGTFQTKSLSLQWSQISVARAEIKYQNDVTLKVFARLECPGGSCIDICVPREGVNTCDAEGNRICVKGSTGPACDQIDYCAENNCADYAICQLLTNGYKCVCGAYEGTRCEKGFDPCQPESPCGPNGQCVAAGPNYECVCAAGWGGRHCDRPASACEREAQRLAPEAVCLNGGSCVDSQDGSSYLCVCLQPWSGPRCKTIDACAEEHCSGHGVCIFPTNGKTKFFCQCNTGWVGETCSYRSQSPCHKASLKLSSNWSAVCLHGGKCVDNPNGVDFSCECRLGWLGPQCEVFFIASPYFTVPVSIGAAAFLLVLVLCLWRARKRKSRQGTTPMIYTSTPLTERSTENPANSLIMPYAIYIASNLRNTKENKGNEPRVFRRPTPPTDSEQSSGPTLPPRNRLLKTSTSDEQPDH
nr:protein jagged 1 [Hymenolepis microstoma]